MEFSKNLNSSWLTCPCWVIFCPPTFEFDQIFRIDEDDRDLWFYRYILNSLTDYEEDKYIEIYKKNKIECDITEKVINLIEIGNIHKHIVNSLDNTYMITKRCSRNIFNTIKNTVYKYRGFE